MASNPKTHPIVWSVRNFFSRFTQNPEIYPIRFYKKTEKFRKYKKAYLFR